MDSSSMAPVTGSDGGSAIVSAVFDQDENAQQAVDALQELGIDREVISVVSRSADTGLDPDAGGAAAPVEHAGDGALAGAGVGAAVGAIFGLAAAVIPGAGPFITAGALASWLGTTAGAAASGAIVGSTSGALAGAITGWGVPPDEATYYAGELERGAVYVGVDAAQTAITPDSIRDVFRSFGGRIGIG